MKTGNSIELLVYQHHCYVSACPLTYPMLAKFLTNPEFIVGQRETFLMLFAAALKWSHVVVTKASSLKT